MPKLDLHWVDESIGRGHNPLLNTPTRQLTNSTLISWGVYREQVNAWTGGERSAFLPRSTAEPVRLELWVADLESHAVARVGPAAQVLIASTPLMASVCYVRPEADAGLVLARLNLGTLELADVHAFTDCPVPRTPRLSTGERWFVSSARLHDNVFGLCCVGLDYAHRCHDTVRVRRITSCHGWTVT